MLSALPDASLPSVVPSGGANGARGLNRQPRDQLTTCSTIWAKTNRTDMYLKEERILPTDDDGGGQTQGFHGNWNGFWNIYVYIYIYVYVCICVYIYTDIFLHLFYYLQTHLYIYMFKYIYMCKKNLHESWFENDFIPEKEATAQTGSKTSN